MTPEQKQRIAHEISNWRNARNDHSAQLTGDRMAALLQELIDAPKPEPVAKVMHVDGLNSNNLLDCDLPTGTLLYTAPPAEAPAQDFEDALEQAFWDFDARHKGYKKTIRPISERDAFKQVLRNFMHEHGGAEAPADVARDAARLDWLDAQCSENNGRHICCLPGGLRVAIDAAMHEKGQS